MKEEITDEERFMLDEFARRRKESFWSDVFKYLDWEVEKALPNYPEIPDNLK